MEILSRCSRLCKCEWVLISRYVVVHMGYITFDGDNYWPYSVWFDVIFGVRVWLRFLRPESRCDFRVKKARDLLVAWNDIILFLVSVFDLNFGKYKFHIIYKHFAEILWNIHQIEVSIHIFQKPYLNVVITIAWIWLVEINECFTNYLVFT